MSEQFINFVDLSKFFKTQEFLSLNFAATIYRGDYRLHYFCTVLSTIASVSNDTLSSEQSV